MYEGKQEGKGISGFESYSTLTAGRIYSEKRNGIGQILLGPILQDPLGW